MSEISGKRRRSECQTNGTNVFFIRDGIHRKRMTILERNAQTLGLVVSDHFRESIDYIISDFEYEEQVMESIGCDIRELKAVVVNTRWLTDSMQSQQLMPFNTNYRLKRRHKRIDSKTSNECSNESSNGDYICQRMSSLNHQNSKLSEPLEVMAKEAKLRAHLFDTVRYLGFKKAAAVLKSLPFAVKHVDEVSCLKDIGKHSMKIIQEILDEGVSREVDTIRNSDWFKTMTLFTNIYGIGPKTAQKWYDLGLRSLDDVMNTTSVLKNQSLRVLYGMAFYTDLNAFVTKSESNQIISLVRKAIDLKLGNDSTNIEIHLTGGFSRGKECGHDVDILITHKEEGRETGLLSLIYQQLKEMDLILLANSSKSENSNSDTKSKDNTLDNFDKMFTLFKLPADENNCQLKTPYFDRDNTKAIFDFVRNGTQREWKLCRVDLIVCPKSQLCLAFIGWTGNEMFCRSLREYAKKELNFRLDNHCLHDFNTGTDLNPRTEQEVFELLKLPFIPKHLRNP